MSTSCWWNDGASKEDLPFEDQSKQIVFSFSSRNFLEEMENMLSVFLLSYRNTPRRVGEPKKAVETLTCRKSRGSNLIDLV